MGSHVSLVLTRLHTTTGKHSDSADEFRDSYDRGKTSYSSYSAYGSSGVRRSMGARGGGSVSRGGVRSGGARGIGARAPGFR
jgi:hypothetical protein